MVLSSDLITSIETHAQRTERNRGRARVDIIIGTQLVAKGHNFPRLNLVGVVDGRSPASAMAIRRAAEADVSIAEPGGSGRAGARSGAAASATCRRISPNIP